MKPEDLKNGINAVKPDCYMETRISASVADAKKTKRSRKKIFAASLSVVLCGAVAAAGLGFGLPQRDVSPGQSMSDVDYSSGNFFVMNVYAAENTASTPADPTPVDDHTVILPEGKIKIFRDTDGSVAVGHETNVCASISGSNIKSVTYKCDRGSFFVWDWDLLEYLRNNGEYYDIIVPYTDEYAEKSHSELLQIMMKHIENGDYDKYFTDIEKKTIEEYYVADYVYDDHDKIIGVGLVSIETFRKIQPSYIDDNHAEPVKSYTAENVLNRTEEIGSGIYWDPDVSMIFDNPDMALSELPHDTITVEVTFLDGSVQYGTYDFSFNDSGELVVDRVVS